jgi:transposase-like protein
MMTMHKFRREAAHKLRVLKHAEAIGDVGKACRYFGVGRASFYRWREAYRQRGLSGLENRKFYQLLTYTDDVNLGAKLAEWERFYNLSRPPGAFNGKAPYEGLRERL